MSRCRDICTDAFAAMASTRKSRLQAHARSPAIVRRRGRRRRHRRARRRPRARAAPRRDPVAVLEREAGIARAPDRSLERGHPRGHLLRARLAEGASVRRGGARALTRTATERGIPARRDGKLIVATRADELPRLDELERRGTRQRGRRASADSEADEIAEVEPHAVGVAALHSPAPASSTSAGSPGRYAADLAARRRHRDVLRGPGVRERTRGRSRRRARGGRTAARAVVSLRRRLVGPARGRRRRARPSRGSSPSAAATCELRPERAELVRSNIYPVPDPDLPFLGAHLTAASTARCCWARPR